MEVHQDQENWEHQLDWCSPKKDEPEPESDGKDSQEQHHIQPSVLTPVLALTFIHTSHVPQLLPPLHTAPSCSVLQPVPQPRFRDCLPPVHTRTSMSTQVLVSQRPAMPPSFCSSNSVVSLCPRSMTRAIITLCGHQLKWYTTRGLRSQ